MVTITASHAATLHPSPSTRWALTALCLSTLMPSLDTSIANAGLPLFAQAFKASFPQVQWIVLAYLLATTTLIVSVGALGDRFPRKHLLLLGILLFTLASLLCALAPTLTLLITARALQGLGAAAMLALTIAIVARTVPKNRTGSALGLLGAMSAIGTTLGPALGGLLIASLGWRSIFLINLPLGALAFCLAQRHLPLDAPTSPPVQLPPHDNTHASARQTIHPAINANYLLSTLFLALALAAYALAMTLGKATLSPLTFALLAMALLCAALFTLLQIKSPSPIIPHAILRNRPICAGLAMSLLVSAVMMSTLVVGPFYLTGALLLSPAAVGTLLSVGPLVAALTAFPAGRLVDRFGPRPITLLGLCALATGSLLLALVPLSAGIPGYLAPIVFLTAGYALFQSANNTAILTAAHASLRAVVSSLLTLSRNLGLITGASAMGALFACATTSPDITTAPPQSITTGMHTTFAAAAVLITLAITLALPTRAIHPPTTQ